MNKPEPRRFSARQRSALYLYSGGKCAECGIELEPGWHADHVHPYSKGGETDVLNGAALCPSCNLAKGARVTTQSSIEDDPRSQWQAKAIEDFLAARHDFLVTATPGAGKTRMALGAARELRDAGEIARIIVVVPRENLKHQWADVAASFDIDLNANYRNDDGALTAARDGAVTTYQQVIYAPSIWRMHTNTRTLVIFDEVHHAGDEKSWGSSIREAFDNAARKLLLSGTPFRTDGTPIPFVTYDGNGVSISHGGINYADAVGRNIVRPIQFEVLDGNAQWIDLGTTVSMKMSDGIDHEEQMRAWSVMRDPNQQWIPSVFCRANAELTRQREQLPSAGGLIYATTIDDAEHYAELMSNICGEPVTVIYSKMEGDPNAEIKRFANGNQRWLVAVKMVSEGVDIPRAVVGVFASDQMTEMWFRQVVGRHVRIIGPDDEIVATMFIPNIAKLCDLANRIESEAMVALREASRERTEMTMPRGEIQLSLIEPLHASEADLTEVIRQGEVLSRDEISYAEQLRQAHGLTQLHASDIANLLRDHDRRQQQTEARVQHIGTFPVAEVVRVSGDTERKALRKQIRQIVGRVHRATGREHQEINYELMKVFGGRVTEADTDGLRKRIAYLEGLL